MTTEWTDQLAGARMQVDQRFQDRLEQSSFTSQEWGLVMTAIDWEIDDPDRPEEAELVADTSQLPEIIPELESIQQQMGGAQRPVDSGPSTGGIFGRLKRYFQGFQSDSPDEPDSERLADATELVDGYTRELQSYLKERDRWEQLCAAATDEHESAPER